MLEYWEINFWEFVGELVKYIWDFLKGDKINNWLEIVEILFFLLFGVLSRLRNNVV
jgi:hypothetical protein